MSPLEKLKAALVDTADVYINSGVEEERYLAELREDLRLNLCEPFPVTAKVMPPGFPGVPIGSDISGFCVARRSGYWLVYRPDDEQFYCFWGCTQDNLGAHGVVGSPLYCWSA